MKMVRFLPFAFLAGVHGFALFAPYMAALLVVAHLLRRRQAA